MLDAVRVDLIVRIEPVPYAAGYSEADRGRINLAFRRFFSLHNYREIVQKLPDFTRHLVKTAQLHVMRDPPLQRARYLTRRYRSGH